MVSEIIDGYGAKLILAVVVVSAALFLLFLVSRMLRNRGSAGPRRTGTGSRPRLAVLDSVAVDANRRLLLVRRDEVEHLILIGGPSDVVVESRIGIAAAVSPALPERRAPLAAPAAPIAPRPDAKVQTRPAPPPPAPAKEAAARVQVRQPTVRPPAAAEAAPAKDIEADDPAAWPAGPRHSPAPEEVRRDVEDVLDDARGRVFGASAIPEADRAQPVRQEPAAKPPVQPAGGIEPTARFEEVLDAEIAGDLSAVTPGAAGQPRAADRPAAPLPERPKGGPVVDAEMARLLGELSVKR